MNAMKFKLYDILLCLSEAVDLISPTLNSHHQRVAYLSYRLAEHIGMPVKERQAVLMQGLLHDIGALSLDERLSLLEEEPGLANSHAFRGSILLSSCKPLESLAVGVKYHHIPWDYGHGRVFNDDPVPITSHLLHLAERVCAGFDDSENVIAAVSEMLAMMRTRENEIFSPQLIKALCDLGTKEYIWLELADRSPLNFLPGSAKDLPELDLDGVLSIAKIFSHVIDFRSHFTATHSAGVARTAEKLAEFAGMSGDERKMILIAGYLHDLGKLAVSSSVLEKPGKLNVKEFSAIRAHTFYTYRLLNMINGFSTINQWASFHHERNDGQGYPFHLKGEQIPLGSRIMTVADVFNAVTEHRPYRRGMEKQEIIHVIKSMTDNGTLCSNVVYILLDNIDLFIKLSKATQQKAAEEYDSFFSSDEDRVANAI